ncbi:hypothetical protein P3T18_003100 [Paraburkholderia sp. GAS199]|uniref:hypothetical protein n=1 Tax=Paraburkholderia sp. GAS199 TaxID=3035126 RepID=UPI003D1BA028
MTGAGNGGVLPLAVVICGEERRAQRRLPFAATAAADYRTDAVLFAELITPPDGMAAGRTFRLSQPGSRAHWAVTFDSAVINRAPEKFNIYVVETFLWLTETLEFG